MSRIALASIQALTFYKDSLTTSRRGKPVQQLECVGGPCDLFEPDVVRCVNQGGEGVDVDWKCEADLPEALRFGRVQVSCEGWSAPGDSYVLKGSCGLEYRLVQVPNKLRNTGSDRQSYSDHSDWFSSENLASVVFYALWFGILAFIIYAFLKSCLGERPHAPGSSSQHPPATGPSGGGWFPNRGPYSDGTDTPPPYSKYPSSSTTGQPSTGASGPGLGNFWTGLALGGLGTYFMNRNRGGRVDTEFDRAQRERERRREWDWERERRRPTASSSGGLFGRQPSSDSTSRFGSTSFGEGGSDLGSMRRSTGYGGSNVR